MKTETRLLSASVVLSSSLMLGACASMGGVGQSAGKPLEVGGSQRGELTSSSPRNAKDGSHYERFSVALEADQVVRFALSGALTGVLSLENGEGDFLGSSSDMAGGDISLSQRAEEKGTYVLSVSGQDHRSFGPFRVDAREMTVRNSGALAVGDEIFGWLEGVPNVYTLEVTETGLYQIIQRSSEMDSLLKVSGNGVDLQDDDSAGNLDAQVAAFLEPGSYRVEAGWAMSAERGAYTLTVTSQPLPTDVDLTMGGELPHDDTINGYLAGSPLEYQLVLSEAASVTLTMASSTLDSYLEINGEAVSFSDDDSGGGNSGLDARISTFLGAGTYTVRASQVSGQSGLFTLTTRVESQNLQERLQGLTALRPGANHSARLSSTQDEYKLTIPRSGTYAIEMSSGELDAFLELYGDGVTLSDDDGGSQNVDARITAELPAGDYLLVARTYSRSGAGDYTLTVTRQ